MDLCQRNDVIWMCTEEWRGFVPVSWASACSAYHPDQPWSKLPRRAGRCRSTEVTLNWTSEILVPQDHPRAAAMKCTAPRCVSVPTLLSALLRLLRSEAAFAPKPRAPPLCEPRAGQLCPSEQAWVADQGRRSLLGVLSERVVCDSPAVLLLPCRAAIELQTSPGESAGI